MVFIWATPTCLIIHEHVWSKWLSWYGAEEEGESLVCNFTMRDVKLTVRKGCIGFISKKSEDINQIAY